jgi:flagellin
LASAYTAATTTIATSSGAASALSNVQTAIQNLADMRARVGANIQRLSMTDDQVNILNENLSAANSRIKDVDVAEESTRFAKANILVQSGTSMLAQANMLPSSALQLI